MEKDLKFEISGEETTEEKRLKFKNALKYLHSFIEKPNEFFNNQSAHDALNILKTFEISFSEFEEETKDLFLETLIKLIQVLIIALLNQYDLNRTELFRLLETCLKILVLHIGNNKECLQMQFEEKYIKFIDEFPKILNTVVHEYKSANESPKKRVQDIISLCLELILRFCGVNCRFRQEWERSNLFECVLQIGNFLKKEENNDDFDKYNIAELKVKCFNIIFKLFDYEMNHDALLSDIYFDELDQGKEEGKEGEENEKDEEDEKLSETENEIEEDSDSSSEVGKTSVCIFKSTSEENNDKEEIHTTKIKKTIEFLLNFKDHYEILKDPLCEDAFEYLLLHIKDETDEALHQIIFDDGFNNFVLELLKFTYAEAVSLTKGFTIDLDSDFYSNEYKLNLVKIFTYMFDLVSLCNEYLRFELRMKFLESNESLATFLAIILDEGCFCMASKYGIIKYGYFKVIDKIVGLLKKLVPFANKYRDTWKCYDYETIYKLIEIYGKYGIDYSDILSTIPFILQYEDDDENQFIQLWKYENERVYFETFKDAITNLTHYTFEQALNSRKFMYMLFYMNERCSFTYYDKLETEIKEHSIRFIVHFIQNAHHAIVDSLKKTELNSKQFGQYDLKIIKIIYLFFSATVFLQDLTTRSVDVSIRIIEIENNSIEILFGILNDEYLKEVMSQHEFYYNYIFKYLKDTVFSSSVILIYNLSKIAYKCRERWENINAMQSLLSLSDKFSDNFYISMCYMAIANVATDDDLSRFSSSMSVLEYFVNEVKYFACILSENSDEMCRAERQIGINDKEKVEIITFNNWCLHEPMDALYRFCINDDIKEYIYCDLNMKKYLRDIIYNGNEVEQEYALKVLNQLCFKKKIADDVLNDEKLIELLRNKVQNKTESTRENLVKVIKAILWLIKDESTKENEYQKSNEMLSKKNAEHIMISYNSGSRNYCLEVKKYLESIGHKVWIDVENIHGSSIDAMAHAVESAWCVLICMTEKYKESNNCRLEAEYVAKLNKPFIPLIMEKSYKPRGWLGILLGSRIFIDYTKNDLDECNSRVAKELSFVYEEVNKQKVNVTLEKSATANSDVNTILTWSTSDVAKWFDEKNIANSIKNYLSPCDGKLLDKLKKLSNNAPEFFHTTLRTETNAGMMEIAVFSDELKTVGKR